jgi:diaminopimelate epimerase
MPVVFHKMHGAGNDFVVLDLREQTLELDPGVARAMADRGTGIGCDQLLVVRPPRSPKALADFEVWNADGSRAEQCGNGVRCIGLYLARRGETPRGSFIVNGPLEPIEIAMGRDGEVRVDMGIPDFDPARIPLDLEPTGHWYRLETDLGPVRAGAVSMGNPHALVLVDDVHTDRVARLGPLLSSHPAFPRGCNAGFARIIDPDTVQLRVFERGAGETRACGSGACAAAAILRRERLVNCAVEVLQEGGTLKIEWTGDHDRLVMTGPAVYIFEGTLE